MAVKIVSACLAGINCRYDGRNSANETIIKLVREGRAIPVCPEQLAGFSTPRENCEMRNGRVFTASGKDVTAQMQKGAEETLKIARLIGAKEAILKSRSPSCGCGKIYDGSFSKRLANGDFSQGFCNGKRLVEGNGIAAELLMRNGIKVFTEKEI